MSSGPLATVPLSSARKKVRKTTRILSFDGGGSKGVMEVVVLDIVFRMATLIKEKPQVMLSIEQLLDPPESSGSSGTSDLPKTEVLELLKSGVDEPIHPTEAFDMIVGTSTGGLICLALLAGKKDKSGKRTRMTVEEVKNIYIEETKNLFSETSWPWWTVIPSIIGLFKKTAARPYSQKPLEKALARFFGEGDSAARMQDVNDRCIGGCVAKQTCLEHLEFFHTASLKHMNIPITKVLLATCDAPVYFKGPVEIEGKSYVDGGVGGNCPLKQAIPTAFEVLGYDTDLFVVSLAPPPGVTKQLPESSFRQIKFWLTESFPSQVTNGTLVYQELKEEYSLSNPASRFYRLAPKGEKLVKFEMDETDVQAMIEATEEWITGDGMMEILPLVFAVVAEILERDARMKSKVRHTIEDNGLPGEEVVATAATAEAAVMAAATAAVVEKRQLIYDWIVTNGQKLALKIQSSEVMKDEKKLETLRNLLISIEKVLEAFDGEELKRKPGFRVSLLTHLGNIASAMGNTVDACGHYDRALATYDAKAKESRSRPERINGAEIHRLHGKVLLDLGDIGLYQDQGQDNCSRGALWHTEQALKELEELEMGGKTEDEEEEEEEAADDFNLDPDVGRNQFSTEHFQFLKKVTLLQIGKLYMDIGDYIKALSYLDLCFPEVRTNNERRWSAVVRTGFRMVVAEKSSFTAFKSVVKRDMGYNNTQFEIMFTIALTLFKSGDLEEAKKVFEAISKLPETPIDSKRSKEVDNKKKHLKMLCHGFLRILGNKPVEAITHFRGALDEIESKVGKRQHHRAIVDNFFFLGIAAYEADLLQESLRYFRRAKHTILLVDNDKIHPVLYDIYSMMGIILVQWESNSHLEEARQCFGEASMQLKYFQKREQETPQLEQIEIKNNLACLDLTERKYPAAIARLEEALNLLAKMVLFDKRLEGTLKTNLDRAKTANSDVKPNQFFFRYLTINK